MLQCNCTMTYMHIYSKTPISMLLSIIVRAHDASFDVTHGKLVGGGHVITVSGTVIFSNVEKLLDHFIILAEKSLHNSVMIIDLTHCHYLDQISAKVLSNGFQYPSIKTVFIVCCKGILHSPFVQLCSILPW